LRFHLTSDRIQENNSYPGRESPVGSAVRLCFFGNPMRQRGRASNKLTRGRSIWPAILPVMGRLLKNSHHLHGPSTAGDVARHNSHTIETQSAIDGADDAPGPLTGRTTMDWVLRLGPSSSAHGPHSGPYVETPPSRVLRKIQEKGKTPAVPTADVFPEVSTQSFATRAELSASGSADQPAATACCFSSILKCWISPSSSSASMSSSSPASFALEAPVEVCRAALSTRDMF
jgi:hypothetical protein